ncbi:MAG: prolipoprotein diacylglyceryl transferase [Actinomycetota bacterium]|nr:prolipoprotein diacylglyceryl transferase [Actinomycetota bacterium]
MTGLLQWHVYPRIAGVSPHGIGIAVGFLLGGMLMVRYAERKGIVADHVWAMLMRAVFGVIIGARLFYVFGHLTDYWPNVLDIFKVYQGGLVFYGGVFGGIVAAVPYAKKHHLPFWKILDAAAPGFPLGLIFGRIGDLIVGDHLGGPSTLAFAFRPSGGSVPVSVPGWPACLGNQLGQHLGNAHLGCHQTALYDLWNVIIILPIVLWLARKERPDGFMIIFTATFYGFGRLLVDFARTGTATYAGLRGTQWISLFLILLGIWYTVQRARGAITSAPLPAEVTNPLIATEGGVQPEDWPPPEMKSPTAPDERPMDLPEHPLAPEQHNPEPPDHPLV